jgi:hypothetical protein
MKVNVECPCGQPYEFDVEPENGRMPVTVSCPTCGADGTDLANAFLAKHVAAPGLSIARPPVRVISRAESAPVAPPAAPAPRSFEQVGEARDVGTNIFKGVFGAVVAAAAGMVAWYLLIKFTGYEIGYAAWGVGVLTGLGAKMLAGRGHQVLGLTAGACAFVAILGGQYLVAKGQFDEAITTFIDQQYDKRMELARSALAAQSEADLKAVLAKYSAEDGQAPDVSRITDEQLAEFRTEELPRLRSLTEGKPDRSEYAALVRRNLNSPGLMLNILKESVGLFTLLWLFLGVGSAYRIAGQQE